MKQAVFPFIPVLDVWPRGLTEAQLSAYKACIEAELLQIQVVRTDPEHGGYTSVSYLSCIPVAWIHDTLRDLVQGETARFEECCEKVGERKHGRDEDLQQLHF